MNPMLNYALLYLRAGFSMIPLQPRSKVPLLAWSQYASTRPTEAELHTWFHDTQNNLAILTGGLSRVVVADIDSAEGELNAKKIGLISPLSVVTGKGRHYYFRNPSGALANSVRSLPGVDIRSDRGYVLAPPSVHPSGRRYMWAGGVFNPHQLPVFPLEIFLHKTASESPNQPGWISEALAGMREGNRNDTFAKVVGKLHRDRWRVADILGLLRPVAERVGFPEAELQTVVNSVTRYPVPGQGGLFHQQHREPVRIRTFDTDAGEYESRLRQRTGDTSSIFHTGFPSLDTLTGGLRKQEVLTVAARTGVGKTNWLIRAGLELCRTGRSVLFFATEMSFDSIWERYIAAASVDGGHAGHRFLVCDDFVPDVGRVEEAIQQVKPDVFMFDHINHVGEENQVLSEFMKGLKLLARKYDIPCVVAAQLNRQADWFDPKTHEKIIPRLSMIKGSGTIEQVSAQVLLLSELSNGPEQNDLIGNLDKNRYGEKGLISLVLKKQPYRLEEVQ